MLFYSSSQYNACTRSSTSLSLGFPRFMSGSSITPFSAASFLAFPSKYDDTFNSCLLLQLSKRVGPLLVSGLSSPLVKFSVSLSLNQQVYPDLLPFVWSVWRGSQSWWDFHHISNLGFYAFHFVLNRIFSLLNLSLES